MWPPSPQEDAAYWLDWNNVNNTHENRGTETTTPVATGTLTRQHDHLTVSAAGRLNFGTLTSSWLNGYAVAMWIRNTPYNSGWKTFLHRAIPSGTLTNEAYVVVNTTQGVSKVVSGLKFGSVHREYTSTVGFPTDSDWTHVVVSWQRSTTRNYRCEIYINGVQRGSFSATNYAVNTKFSTEALYVLGNRTAGEWSGDIDDFLLWSRGLSAGEVSSLYNQGRSFRPDFLVGNSLSFPRGQAGELYLTADFVVTTWSATGLPSGIFLDSNGRLYGASTTPGTGTMAITASSPLYTMTKNVAWTVS